ncbi:unnamed protein product [Adineta steineri]|uniref:ADP ribosyltransferase domain-containing protein n=1 Tax=Adineta steineri TaxID=433720 RepID=A0A815YMU7_9BILA|nr:unnamed protein product [Adineta steineri]CAF1572308.1 unnamed protein product [Adineta steineri]
MAAQKSQENSSSTFRLGASNTTAATTAPTTCQNMAQNYLLVWADASIDETNKDCQNTLTQLRAVVNDITMCTQPNECIEFFDKLKDETSFLITSGSLGQHLVPEIHGMPKLDAIYIFCDNISYHQQWTENWKKIKGIYNNIKDICDALKGGVKQVNQDSISVSFVAANDDVSAENLNQLEPSYMYTQIFKEILLGMEHDHKQAINTLTMYWSNLYSNNMIQLNIIDEFKRNYHPEKAILWYTREYFTYQMLNQALRTLDANIIINMGFFIRDLHQQINQLYEQQLPNYQDKPFVVYRGQGLKKTDFDKLKNTNGGLMSFNNFLSTSNDRGISFMYADSASGHADMVGILFTMTIDPRVSSTPFASVKQFSRFEEEDEILFSMHAVFRIGAIKQMGNNDQLYQVELQLTADDDEQLHRLTECISKEVMSATGWKRLSVLLVKTGHFDKAEELYKVLLEQPSSESDKALYYNNLGCIKNDQGDYKQAIEYYEKALGVCEKTLPANLRSLATSYSNMGGVYGYIGEYSKALSFYEKALEIREKILPANHPESGAFHNNIGLVYYNMGEYLKALSFYEKALGIYKENLPENHPALSSSYNNIGSVYDNVGEYSKALSFYEKALGIREKTLPANHPDLATSYNNIGSVYNNVGEYSEALLFYEKALEIYQKTFPSDHPLVASSYNNIGNVHVHMGEYSQALSFYEKVLGIQEKTLPTNHPKLATSYNNIGHTYDKIGEYSKSLTFHEKALGIREKILPSNHPDFSQSYTNLGGLHYHMKEYSKALLYFERALEIEQRSLPANHSDIEKVKKSIEIVKKKF